MGRRKSWFTYVRRLFVSESKPKPEEKPKKWRWLFRKFKFRRYPVLEAPQKALNEATKEQRKQALAVAIATAAAAEAAVAAANAAAEVVRLTNMPCEHERRNQCHAAIMIQCAYRRHLARKALGALKGVVKLQAVVRGELVRRRVVKASPTKSFLLNAQLQMHKRMVPTLLDYLNRGEKINCLGRSKSEELRPHCGTYKSWDLSLVSKEEIEALYRQKQDAIAKRERMMQYSPSQRERRSDQSQESMIHRENKKGGQHEDKEEPKHLSHDKNQLSQLKMRTECKQEWMEEFKSPFLQPRRSFCHVKQKSFGDDGSLPSSPVFPTYMAATKSAKAKSRSLSTPRQGLRLCDSYSGDLRSPFKLKLDSWSSFNGEVIKSGRNSISQYVTSTFGTLN